MFLLSDLLTLNWELRDAMVVNYTDRHLLGVHHLDRCFRQADGLRELSRRDSLLLFLWKHCWEIANVPAEIILLKL